MKVGRFVEFSKPFIDGLKETYSVMMSTELKAHSPSIKENAVASGDISAIIGMNGVFKGDDVEADFKGLLIISWPEEVYIKTASAMIMEEYTEYNEEISDVGAEISNIVMGNAKKVLIDMGYQIEMATPSTVRGNNHEIKYPPKTTVVAITVSSDLGDFTMEICYQELTAS